jgi:hypothetical protein
MKNVITSPFYWYGETAWQINAKGKGLRTDILKSLFGQLQAMMNYHRKVFVFRFDLHTPSYTPDNTLITDFNRPFFKRIKRHYGVKRIAFGWVREKEKKKNQHYHYVVMLDGSKIQHPERLQSWITEIWGHLDGTAHWAGYHLLNRNDEAKKHAVSYHISYLAKARGKGYRPTQTKDYGGSRLKYDG